MTSKSSENDNLDISKLLRLDHHAQSESESEGSENNKRFIEAHINNVNAVASNIMSGTKLPPGIDFGDLVSWGVEGLLKAKKKFVADKGAQFKTYSQFRIRGEILDNIRKEWGIKAPEKYRKQKEIVSNKIAEYVDSVVNGKPSDSISVDKLLSNSMMIYMVSIDDYYEEGQSLNIEDKTQNQTGDLLIKEEYKTLWDAIDNLSEDERSVVEQFYKHEKSQKDISIELGLSRSKVCRLHSKALEKLKKKLEKDYYNNGEST